MVVVVVIVVIVIYVFVALYTNPVKCIGQCISVPTTFSPNIATPTKLYSGLAQY